jgi:transcriptional regulator with XRE-family HTH domain
MFDYRKLTGRIIEKFGTRKAFAEAYGISENAMSQKLSGKMAITTDDIKEWCKPEFLDIPCAEIGVYFFTPKVQED